MMHKINFNKPADKANKQIVPNKTTVNLSSAQKCQLASTGSVQAESEPISSKNSKIPQQDNRSIKSLTGITIKGSKKLTKHELAVCYGFNDNQIGIYEETFQILDKDSNGILTLQEIREVMNSLGYCPTDDYIRQKIKAIDIDNSGTVDFEEFICMMSKYRKVKTPTELDQELKEIFGLFDKNGDGFIDKYELKDMLCRLGEHITEDEVVEMIREADVDGDNKVSFVEFRSILSENKATNSTSKQCLFNNGELR